jgi:hypothetical protein
MERQGGRAMTKRKMLTSVLVAAVFTASCAMAAHAGGGGAGSGDLGFVFLSDCYKVEENENPNFTLEVTDTFGTLQNIRIGKARLVCVTSGAWARQAGSGSDPLNSAFDPTAINAAKCYDVQVKDAAAGNVGTVTDLFGTTESANLGRLTMLCSPASATGVTLPLPLAQ